MTARELRPIDRDTRGWSKSQVISHFIGKDRRVLDAGCGAGDNSVVLQRAGCSVLGVDRDTAKLKLAEPRCDRVIPADITSEDFWRTTGPFDVVLFSDVLEHLLNPEEVLGWARDHCRPSSVVVSLPNVANYATRRELLLGRWNYTEAGILDRTHLRFYTLDTATDLMSTAAAEEMEFAYLFFPSSTMRSAWKRGVLSVGQRNWPRAFGIGFVFHLRWGR